MALTRTISPAIMPHAGGILSFECTYDHRRISIGSEHECDPFPMSPTFSPQQFIETSPVLRIDEELDLNTFKRSVPAFDDNASNSTICPLSSIGRCSSISEGSDDDRCSELDTVVEQYHTKVGANKFQLKRLARISHFSDLDSNCSSDDELTEFDNCESLVRVKSLNPSGGDADFRNGIYLENLDDYLCTEKESTHTFIDMENNSVDNSYASVFSDYFCKKDDRISSTATDRGCFSNSSTSSTFRVPSFTVADFQNTDDILLSECSDKLSLSIDYRSPKDILKNAGNMVVLFIALSVHFILSVVQSRLNKSMK